MRSRRGLLTTAVVITAGVGGWWLFAIWSDARLAERRRLADEGVAELMRLGEWQEIVRQVHQWESPEAQELRWLLVMALARRLPSSEKAAVAPGGDMCPEKRTVTELSWATVDYRPDQDVFIEGGRAALAIERLLRIRLPEHREEMSHKERQEAVAESLTQIRRVAVTEAVEGSVLKSLAESFERTKQAVFGP